MKNARFADLFAGIGGMRLGFQNACKKLGVGSECVFASEIKPHAVKVYGQNFDEEKVSGDIAQIDAKSLSDFDFLLAGFPCQAFSAAGKRMGFLDTRGTLFFEIGRILSEKQPQGFLLENVEGLVGHDKESKQDKIGRTLSTILAVLEELGYRTEWRVLNSKDFGVPQDRRRIYIAGAKKRAPNMDSFSTSRKNVSAILETGLACEESGFVTRLLSRYKTGELYGKAIKDKRGGKSNIHSWDMELKGEVSDDQKTLMNSLLKERRKKKWAADYGIDWMDGMPLTLRHIETFFQHPNLEEMLEDLAAKGYLRKEHPKKKLNGRRVQDRTLPLGYNIVAGKMSFEISKVLDPNGVAPTLVAMDMKSIYVTDGGGLRKLSLSEGLGLFGFPDGFKFDIERELGYDLLGNTVAVPVVSAVAERLLEACFEGDEM